MEPAGDARQRLRHVAPKTARWFRAPGRVNLMGDHTDYNEGFVLPIAIELECVVAADAMSNGRVRARSLDAPGTVDVAADGGTEPRTVEPAWGRYVAGVVQALARRGARVVGADLFIASSVPLGSGLSSSAALELAVALALLDVSRATLDRHELARACQEAEHRATGVPSGIMDQLVSVAGVSGSALRIDCRDLAIEPVALPADVAVVVAHSGLPRTLEDSAYAERRAACQAIARSLGRSSLRDVTLDEARPFPLARHVLTENARVLATADALRSGGIDALPQLFAESHASLRDDFGVSTPELDELVAAFVASRALGARLTGAGFGGCVVALCRADEAASVAERALAAYEADTPLPPWAMTTRAVAGAGPLP